MTEDPKLLAEEVRRLSAENLVMQRCMHDAWEVVGVRSNARNLVDAIRELVIQRDHARSEAVRAQESGEWDARVAAASLGGSSNEEWFVRRATEAKLAESDVRTELATALGLLRDMCTDLALQNDWLPAPTGVTAGVLVQRQVVTPVRDLIERIDVERLELGRRLAEIEARDAVSKQEVSGDS